MSTLPDAHPLPAAPPRDASAAEDEAALAALLAVRPGKAAAADRPGPERLSAWLCGLVLGRDYGMLADLRRLGALTRSGRVRDGAPYRARVLAARFAPREEQRLCYEQVAFLFARYHAGMSRPHRGAGNVGAALRRVGSSAGRGPADAGATRMLDRVVASREVPWRHLQHVVERARAGETAPPSWTGLVDDLTGWKSRERTVPFAWAESFYTPAHTTAHPSRKATSA